MIWLAAGASILALYLLFGLAILVWSAPPPGDRDDLTAAAAAMLVFGWFPLVVALLIASLRGGRRSDPDDLPSPEFEGESDWQTRTWERIDRGDREPVGPSWSQRWLPWIVPAIVLALTVALTLLFGGGAQ